MFFGLNEPCIEFGAGKSLRFMPIDQIARSIGPDQSLAFLFFRDDTTSSLLGKDEKNFFDTWAGTLP